jgi:hypothetical protein
VLPLDLCSLVPSLVEIGIDLCLMVQIVGSHGVYLSSPPLRFADVFDLYDSVVDTDLCYL